MNTQHAIKQAGSATALASLLGITPAAISQWGEQVPQQRQWQLRVLRPDWFDVSPQPTTEPAAAAMVPLLQSGLEKAEQALADEPTDRVASLKHGVVA